MGVSSYKQLLSWSKLVYIRIIQSGIPSKKVEYLTAKYKLVCAPMKDSDQPAHPCSLIRVFDGSSMNSQGAVVSSGINLKI